MTDNTEKNIPDTNESAEDSGIKDTVVLNTSEPDIEPGLPGEGAEAPAGAEMNEKCCEGPSGNDPADKAEVTAQLQLPATSLENFSEVEAKRGKFKEMFGDRPVTRKFLAAALGIALLLNAGISAGLMALFNHDDGKDMPQYDHNGRPEMGQDFGEHRSGKMMPPGSNGQNSPENAAPEQENQSKVSIGIVIREEQGVYVASVTGDNAKSAGFKENDKIVSIDGTDISGSNDLISEVQKHSAGDTVSVTVERDGEFLLIETVLE